MTHARQFFDSLLLRWKQAVVLVVRECLPYLFACQNARTYRRKILDEGRTTDLRADMERCMALELSDLKESHQLELARREQLRKQAQLNLGASTLAATLALGLVKNDAFPLHDHWVVAGISIFAILSLVLSALSALSANHTMPTQDMWLQLRRFSFGRPTLLDDQKAKLIKATYLNQGGNLIIQNYAEASSVSMRNAIVAVGIILVAMILGGRLAPNPGEIARTCEPKSMPNSENPAASPGVSPPIGSTRAAAESPLESTIERRPPLNTFQQVIAAAESHRMKVRAAPPNARHFPIIYFESFPEPVCFPAPR